MVEEECLWTRLIPLNMLESVTQRRNSRDWSKFFVPTVERIVTESIAQHCRLCWSHEDPTDIGDTDSHASTVDLDAVDLDYHNVDEIDHAAEECWQRGNVAGAVSLYKALLRHQTQGDVTARLSTLHKLVLLHLSRARIPDAEPYLQEALDLNRDSLVDVGLLHFCTQKLDRALGAWREAMQLAMKRRNQSLIAVLLNNIAVLHFQAVDYTSSARAFEESLEAQRAMSGSSESAVSLAIMRRVTTLGNLALVYERTQQTSRAIGLLEEALSLCESVSGTGRSQQVIRDHIVRLERGSDDEESAVSMESFDNLSRSSHLFGNSDGLPGLKSAAMWTMQASDCHDYIALGPLLVELPAEQRVRDTVLRWFRRPIDNDNLGETPFMSAEDIEKSAVKKRPKERIPVDVDGDSVVDAELYLKEIYSQAVRHLDNMEYDDAIDLFQSSLRSHQKKFGRDHHLVGLALHNIGMVHMFAKNYAAANDAFNGAIDVRRRVLGPNHPDVAESMMKIGLLKLAEDDTSEALRIFWSLREQFLKTMGYRHPHLPKIINNIGVLQYQRGDSKIAQRSIEIAIEYQRRARETDAENPALDMAMVQTFSNLGSLCFKNGEMFAALHAFEEALERQKLVADADDYQSAAIQENIDFVVTNGGAMRCLLPQSGLIDTLLCRSGCS